SSPLTGSSDLLSRNSVASTRSVAWSEAPSRRAGAQRRNASRQSASAIGRRATMRRARQFLILLNMLGRDPSSGTWRIKPRPACQDTGRGSMGRFAACAVMAGHACGWRWCDSAGRGLLVRQAPVRPRVVAGVAVGVVLQVVLVLRFGLPEIARGLDFGHRLARP